MSRRSRASASALTDRESNLPFLNARFDRGPGCWLWTGPIMATGYGQANLPTGRTMAHRAVYELLVGAIPDGLHIDHVCHNEDTACPGRSTCMHRRCVNPQHLEPVTPGVNVLRGRTIVAAGVARRTCPRGHEYDVELIRGERRWRRCSICINAARMARSRAAGVKPTLAGSPVCRHGHQYTPENTRRSVGGARHCQRCDRDALERQMSRINKPCRTCGGPKESHRQRQHDCLPCQSIRRAVGRAA